MNIPCKDCLLIPACRYKQYAQMIHECSLLGAILYTKVRYPSPGTIHGLDGTFRQVDFKENLKKVERFINPKHWSLRSFTFYVQRKKHE